MVYIDFDGVIIDSVSTMFNEMDKFKDHRLMSEEEKIKFIQDMDWNYILNNSEAINDSIYYLNQMNPKETSILTKVHSLNNEGGNKIKWARDNNIKELSNMFNVEPKLVRTRLKDLSEILENEKQVSSDIEQNYSENNIENVGKSVYSSQYDEYFPKKDSRKIKLSDFERSNESRYLITKNEKVNELHQRLEKMNEITTEDYMRIANGVFGEERHKARQRVIKKKIIIRAIKALFLLYRKGGMIKNDYNS